MADPVRGRHRAVAVIVLATAALVGSVARVPSPAVQLWALVAGVAVGLPHGALDQPAAAARLGRRFGRRWPLPFFGYYLGLAALVVLIWSAEPRVALALFLGLSILHFGLGDTKADDKLRPVAVAAHGGAPIIVPALAHPAEVASIFEALAPGGGDLVGLLGGPAALAWAGAVVTLPVARRPWMRAEAWGPVVELLAVVAAFAVLPPLLAFALYFGILHAPRASLAEATTAGGPPGAALRRLLRQALPASLAASAAAGVAFALLRDARGEHAAALSVIFVGLAALTVPHMALGPVLRRAERRAALPRHAPGVAAAGVRGS